MMTLREYRLREGLTLRELAELLGRHTATVQKYELGIALPTCEVLARIEAVTQDQVRPASFVRKP